MQRNLKPLAGIALALFCIAGHAQHYASWRHLQETVSTGQVELPAFRGSFEGCMGQFAHGRPPVVPNLANKKGRALCFDGFAVLHSGATKTPIYAAEVLNRRRLMQGRGNKRSDMFFPDARLPAGERATLDDYRGSGFDRGHNFPAGDSADAQGMAQSFSLANMMPQAPQNNQGAWARIEQDTRRYAMRASGDVFVITGSVLLPGECVIQRPNCQIGRGLTVPSHIYKLVYDPQTHRAWAHWIANKDDARIQRPITYAELVRRTGIEFLPGMTPND